MAHIVVYLQRTPQGLHPASALSVCWGRDIASECGATLTAVCPGDAGAFDRAIVAAAGRFGADIVLFIGPEGIGNLERRLNPVHILVPWTEEGRTAMSGRAGGPVVPRWIDRINPLWAGADTITGVVAGVMPWHRFDTELEAEYEGDVDDVELPAWISKCTHEPPSFQLAEDGPVTFVSASALDPVTKARLQALGAQHTEIAPDRALAPGTVLVLAPDAGPLPFELANRGPDTRLMVLPGPQGRCDASWSVADWVFPGPWPDVIDQLLDEPWETGHG